MNSSHGFRPHQGSALTRLATVPHYYARYASAPLRLCTLRSHGYGFVAYALRSPSEIRNQLRTSLRSPFTVLACTSAICRNGPAITVGRSHKRRPVVSRKDLSCSFSGGNFKLTLYFWSERVGLAPPLYRLSC